MRKNEIVNVAQRGGSKNACWHIIAIIHCRRDNASSSHQSHLKGTHTATFPPANFEYLKLAH